MGNVIKLPVRPHVVLHGVLVHETRIEGERGIRVVRYDPAAYHYQLDLVDEEGEASVWDGETYLEALAAAEDWRRGGVAVVDRVSDIWRR